MIPIPFENLRRIIIHLFIIRIHALRVMLNTALKYQFIRKC